MDPFYIGVALAVWCFVVVIACLFCGFNDRPVKKQRNNTADNIAKGLGGVGDAVHGEASK